MTRIWGEVRPSCTQACESILCLFLPGPVRIWFSHPSPVLLLEAPSIFTQWIQKQMFRSSPGAFTGSSCRLSASQALQDWRWQPTGPSLYSKQLPFRLQECNSRLGHLPSTLVLQNRTPRQSAWGTLNADRPGIPTGLAILPPVPLSALPGASDLWCSPGLACLSQMMPERNSGFWN